MPRLGWPRRFAREAGLGGLGRVERVWPGVRCCRILGGRKAVCERKRMAASTASWSRRMPIVRSTLWSRPARPGKPEIRSPGTSRLPAALVLRHVPHPLSERMHSAVGERRPVLNGRVDAPDRHEISLERGPVLLKQLAPFDTERVQAQRPLARRFRPFQEGRRKEKAFVPAPPAVVTRGRRRHNRSRPRRRSISTAPLSIQASA